MPVNPRSTFDSVDRAIVVLLQEDGRLGTSELARRISLSPSATAERVRRLTEAGLITGTRATVDPDALGYPIMAFVRLAYRSGNYKPFEDLVAVTPEVIEAHHVTGDDCFIIKVLARSMADLERVTGRLAGLGSIMTNVVYSSPLPHRGVTPAW